MAKKTLYIFSTGLKFDHLTLETISAVKECGRIYSNVLTKSLAAGIARLTPRLTSWTGPVAAKHVKQILKAFETLDTVGFLTCGNPVLLNGFVRELAAAASGKKIRVKVLEAVSSIEALLICFNITLENDGLRLITAEQVVYGAELTPGVDTVFFSPGILNTPGRRKDKAVFLHKVGAAYPADTRVHLAVFFVNSEKYSVKSDKIKNLPSLLSKATLQHTMYVPGAKSRRFHAIKKTG